MEKKLLKLNDAAAYIGVSRQTFYRIKERNPDFPRPIVYSEQTKLYKTDELLAFMEARRENA